MQYDCKIIEAQLGHIISLSIWFWLDMGNLLFMHSTRKILLIYSEDKAK